SWYNTQKHNKARNKSYDPAYDQYRDFERSQPTSRHHRQQPGTPGGTAFQAVVDHGQDARATGGTAFQAVVDHGQDARATQRSNPAKPQTAAVPTSLLQQNPQLSNRPAQLPSGQPQAAGTISVAHPPQN